jgi:hypothetical protein
MMKRLCSLGAVFVLSGAFVAGCGSSKSSSSSSTPSATSTPAAAASTPSTASTPAIPTATAALAACKTNAARSPLSESLKAKYVSLCERALSGHEAGVKQASEQLCKQIANALPAAEKSVALAECGKT